MSAEDHVAWIYREACVRAHKDLQRGVIRGEWFDLATMVERLFPDEVNAYRVLIGADPVPDTPTGGMK